MTRNVEVIDAGQPLAVFAALRRALAGEGPAILPLAAPVPLEGSQAEVPRPVALVVQTSGSTAAPKRVMLSADALLASAAASSGALGGPGQWLLALPAHYIAGIQVLVRSIAAQTDPVVLPAGSFDPLVFTEHAERLSERLRFTSLVPAQLARLLDAASDNDRVRAALQRFTAVLIGGQAMPPALSERATELGVPVVRTYGSSETAGGFAYNGLPIGNTKVRLEAGELMVSGAVLAEGYLGDPDLTRHRFVDVHGERWYRTGDLGEIDPVTGSVRVLGRSDNVIISGGEKVSLDAVEKAIRTLPGWADAVVVGAADPTWGEVPVVVRALPEGSSDPAPEAALEAVRGVVGASLGRAARPARIVTVAEIPTLASGKPDRRALRAVASATPEGD